MLRLSPVMWLVILTAVLLSALVSSTLLVEHASLQLDARAAEIADNATPSITALAAARTGMRLLELGAGRYLGARGTDAQPSRASLDEARRSIDAHLVLHDRMPYFDGERELTTELLAAKRRLFGDVDEVIAHSDAGRLAEARTLLRGGLTADADKVDLLTARLIMLNNEHAGAAAVDIAQRRRRTSTLALIVDAVSVLLGVVLLAAAVRASRLYHRMLDEQRRLAELRAQELDHYAARVAHDLKGPLASVVLGTSVAALDPSEAPHVLERVQRTSKLMSEMVDALLAVARVEPAQLRPAPATLVAPIVNVLVDEVRAVAAAAQATVRVGDCPPKAAVACSAGVLASVLSNLLQNAVKYIGGASGERVVSVNVRVHDPRDAVRFEVHDTGPGVPPQIAERIFERYVRGERSTGLGLGLATVKHLVVSAGGRLGVESAAGKGSCFWFELPRAPSA